MKFSVITPSYRQLDWLALCIASVADQVQGTNPPISVEHIIQDAGTPEIQPFAQKFNATLYVNQQKILDPSSNNPFYQLSIYSEQDHGMYDAINRGIAKATGDILCYLNCDEQFLPSALTTIAAYFQRHPSTEILCAGVLVVDKNGHLISNRPGLKPWLCHVYADHLPIFTAALFYKRHVVEKPWKRFDTRYKDLADAAWVIERLRDGSSFHAIRDYISTFTDTGDNMNLKPNARAEAYYLHKKLAPLWTRLLRLPIVLLHRIRKFLRGDYLKQNLSYAIYTLASPTQRIPFTHPSQPIWWDRLHITSQKPAVPQA
ncbi:MAG: glycosyltransferase [Methylacidiphilales bacterium]|nr:glycosyltransferase [Candidatus Methylacidiphilales bacterium]MDW8349421.1 glycosyltransferase [Verrucomicrobiae bacterium]